MGNIYEPINEVPDIYDLDFIPDPDKDKPENSGSGTGNSYSGAGTYVDPKKEKPYEDNKDKFEPPKPERGPMFMTNNADYLQYVIYAVLAIVVIYLLKDFFK